MAGMFYSLQEAAEKLNKTEEELKQIVQEGKLREFRDGPNLLFKVEEVEALMSEAGAGTLEEIPEPEVLEAEDLGLEVVEPETPEPEALEPEALDTAALEPEPPKAELTEPEVPELEVSEPEGSAVDMSELEALEVPELEVSDQAPEILEPQAPAPSETDEILLASETGSQGIPSDLTDADTAITSMGTNVLGETGGDYDITDDTMAETAIPTGTAGPEVPLEEIEEDVNLDSFGSGSGLLDLSLQADDTSLGGILDEIYTSEDDVAEPAEGVPDSAAGMAVEAEEMIVEEDIAAVEAAPQAAALARPFIEAAPDAQSNTLGMLLFLPLLIVIYTTVVAVSGLREVMPSILESIQGLIWFIMGGAVALTVVVAAAAFMIGGDRDETAKKQKKAKKPKEKKAKKSKEKKPKKSK
ncbi:MAG: helix-turn-helix domain-containing protein [Planctomycetota bacterium]|jgi:hypothetical protein